MIAALVAATVVWAGTPEEWSSTYDARLSQALGAEPSEAIAVYEALVAQIPAEEDQRGEVLYWLGLARWSAGDLAGAKRSLLGRIALREQAIQSLPYAQDFRLNTAPWVRGWERGKESDLRVTDGPDGRVLQWDTELMDGQTDFIAFGLDTDGERVTVVSFRVRSESVTAKVRAVLEDDAGRVWLSEKLTVRMGRWTELRLPVKSFQSAEAASIDPRSIVSLTLQDLTALHTDARGENILWLDDLSVR